MIKYETELILEFGILFNMDLRICDYKKIKALINIIYNRNLSSFLEVVTTVRLYLNNDYLKPTNSFDLRKFLENIKQFKDYEKIRNNKKNT